MGNRKQNPGLTDEEKKREKERADYGKGWASKRKRQKEQGRRQQNDPKRETTR